MFHRGWEWHNDASACDASHVALAEKPGVPLITTGRRPAEGVKGIALTEVESHSTARPPVPNGYPAARRSLPYGLTRRRRVRGRRETGGDSGTSGLRRSAGARVAEGQPSFPEGSFTPPTPASPVAGRG
ncbi:hypothetical protein GCM10023075_01910 [Streptosporangium album]